MWTLDPNTPVSVIQKKWTEMLVELGHRVNRTVIPEGYTIPFDFRKQLLDSVFIPITP